MNPLRQALHTAARAFAKQAHLAWCEAEAFMHSAFKNAADGKQLERVLAETEYANYRAEYFKNLTKAKRIREMMK